jgi:hypothetical protein
VWDRGRIDTSAPGFGLVIAVDRIIYGEARRRAEITQAERRQQRQIEGATDDD